MHQRRQHVGKTEKKKKKMCAISSPPFHPTTMPWWLGTGCIKTDYCSPPQQQKKKKKKKKTNDKFKKKKKKSFFFFFPSFTALQQLFNVIVGLCYLKVLILYNNINISVLEYLLYRSAFIITKWRCRSYRRMP